MNKKLLVSVLFLAVVIVVVAILLILLRGNEDDWVRDNNGVWVRHGNSSEVPGYVQEQFDAVTCALVLYTRERISGKDINSQCLGVCREYAVDLVNSPRSEEDNLDENQCSEFKEGKVKKFIELDKEGKIVRVVD